MDNVRSGLIIYSDEPEVIFPLEHNQTYDGLRDLILNATHPIGLTYTDNAILTAIDMLNNVTKVREGVPRILTIFTDGQSTDGVNQGPPLALNQSITSFAIGIGDEISQDELLLIANNDSSRVYTIQSYDALTEFFFKLNTLTCEVPQQPGLNSTVNDTLVGEEKRYYEFEIPLEGITISIQVGVGGVVGYYSYSEDTPSSALYDGFFDTATAFIPWRNLTLSRNQADGKGAVVYVTIEGTTAENGYSIEAVEGDFAVTTEATTVTVPSTTVTVPSTTVTVPSTTVTVPSTTVTVPSSTVSEEPNTTPASSKMITAPAILIIVTSVIHFCNW